MTTQHPSDLAIEFPEYKDVIETLKHHDKQFAYKLQKYYLLDHQILQLEEKTAIDEMIDLEQLKRQRLALKDELFQFFANTESV